MTSKPVLSLTPSLVNSFLWMWEAPAHATEARDGSGLPLDHWAEERAKEAEQSFLKALRREREPDNAFTLRGMEFEDEVQRVADGGGKPGGKIPGADEEGALLAGAEFQVPLRGTFLVDGERVEIRGRADAMLAGRIYDMKRVSRYSLPKYSWSCQHGLYLAMCPEALDFEYLACDDAMNVHHEWYGRSSAEDALRKVGQFLLYVKSRATLSTILRTMWTRR